MIHRQVQWAGVCFLISCVLAGLLFFLWYPLLFEGRLGKIARIRRKTLAVSPGWERVIRTVLFLPQEELFSGIQREITNEVRSEIEKDGKQEEDVVRQAALTLLLYLRPDQPNIAFPVDPDQLPIENANDQTLLHDVIEKPEKRHHRNLLVWEYLERHSKSDGEKIVKKVFQKTTSTFFGGKLNPLLRMELWLRERQLIRRARAALQHAKENLEASNGVVTIRLHPKDEQWDPSVAIVDVKSKRFSSFILDRVTLEFSVRPEAQLELLRDDNGNGRVDSNDLVLGHFDIQEKERTSKEEAPLFEARIEKLKEFIDSAMEIPANSGVDPYYGTPMFDGNATTRFFIRSSASFESIGLLDAKLKFRNAVTGQSGTPEAIQFIDDETVRYREEIIESPEDFIKRHPQFLLRRDAQQDSEVVLPSGVHRVDGIIIVPETVTLRILPGARLFFAPNSSLISYAPVVAEGTRSNPIVMTGSPNDHWGTFAMVNTKSRKSLIRYVTVEHASPARINGIVFSGGLAAHQADIEISHSIFRFNHGDDGANIKYADVLIEENQFNHNDFDGLDLDVVSGTVRHNEFLRNGNDGLDVSWNTAVIEQNTMNGNVDKCLSVGERSTAPVSNNTIGRCAVGIAVKDSSTISISNNTIVENRQGVSAYQKKPIFGGGIAHLSHNTFTHNEEDIWSDGVSKVLSID